MGEGPVTRSAIVEDQRPAGDGLETCTRECVGPRWGWATSSSGSSRRLMVSTSGWCSERARPISASLAKYHFQDFFRMSGANADDDVGVSSLKAFQNVRQEVDGDRKRSGDLQRGAAGRLRLMDSLAGGSRPFARVARREGEMCGRRRRRSGRRGSERRASPQRLFQRLDAER